LQDLGISAFFLARGPQSAEAEDNGTMNSLLLALSLSKPAGAPVSGELTLRFRPDKDARYSLRRVWIAKPPESGNGSQIHQFTVSYATIGQHLELTVKGFRGKANPPLDHDLLVATRHFSGMKLSRKFASSGPTAAWEFLAGNGSGWLGMMVAKSCGMYEVGPFDVHFAPNPVRVGSSWTALVRLGSEVFESSQMRVVRGDNPVCSYHLDSIDSSRKLARISFRVEAKIVGTFYNIITKRMGLYVQGVKQTGTWTIDLESGMTRQFDSKRFVVSDDGHPTSQRPSELETTITSVTRK
jgi:hypothetical protein